MSMGSYGVALSGLGEIVPSEGGIVTAIMHHGYLERPAGPVVPRSTISTMAQVRDYARAGFHAVVDAFDRARSDAPIEPFVSSAQLYASVAKKADLVAAYDYGGSGQYAGDRADLIATLGTADKKFSGADTTAASRPAPKPAPSNVIKMPTANTASVAVPTTVTTAGIGTAKGAVVAVVAGGLLYLALRKKKRKA